jgi:hypothetical protein
MHILISYVVLYSRFTLNEICSIRYALIYVKSNQALAFQPSAYYALWDIHCWKYAAIALPYLSVVPALSNLLSCL